MRGFFDFTLETSEDKLVFDGGIYNFEELKRELRIKEKALAETAALLVLRKKANAIWGDQEEE